MWIHVLSSVSIQEAYQNKREQYMVSLQRKEETIRQTFVQKVKDKENELKKAEQEVKWHFDCNYVGLDIVYNIVYSKIQYCLFKIKKEES